MPQRLSNQVRPILARNNFKTERRSGNILVPQSNNVAVIAEAVVTNATAVLTRSGVATLDTRRCCCRCVNETIRVGCSCLYCCADFDVRARARALDFSYQGTAGDGHPNTLPPMLQGKRVHQTAADSLLIGAKGAQGAQRMHL